MTRGTREERRNSGVDILDDDFDTKQGFPIVTRFELGQGVDTNDIGSHSIAFSPAGELFVTAHWGQHGVRIWRSPMELWNETGSPYSILETTLDVYGNDVNAVAFHPNGKMLVTGDSDGAVIVWSVELQRTADGEDPSYPRYNATAGASNQSMLPRLYEFAVMQIIPEHQGRVWALAFSPTGEHVVTAGDDGIARLWSVRPGSGSMTLLKNLTGHTELIRDVSWSGDGEMVATAGYDHTVRVWHLGRESEAVQILKINDHTRWISAVAFNHIGSLLATGSWDSTIRFYSIRTERRGDDIPKVTATHISTVKGAESRNERFISLTFNRGNSFFMASSSMAVTRLWSISEENELRVIGVLPREHKRPVVSSIFNMDNDLIATASQDDTAIIYRMPPGACPNGTRYSMRTRDCLICTDQQYMNENSHYHIRCLHRPACPPGEYYSDGLSKSRRYDRTCTPCDSDEYLLEGDLYTGLHRTRCMKRDLGAFCNGLGISINSTTGWCICKPGHYGPTCIELEPDATAGNGLCGVDGRYRGSSTTATKTTTTATRSSTISTSFTTTTATVTENFCPSNTDGFVATSGQMHTSNDNRVSTHRKVETADECAELCAAFTDGPEIRCLWFTYSSISEVCSLYSMVGSTKSAKGFTSYVRRLGCSTTTSSTITTQERIGSGDSDDDDHTDNDVAIDYDLVTGNGDDNDDDVARTLEWENNLCICKQGVFGARCEINARNLCNNGNGMPVSESRCQCGMNSSWTGPNCQYSRSTTCNGGGAVASDGSCLCDRGYGGEFCNYTWAAHCSDHGKFIPDRLYNFPEQVNLIKLSDKLMSNNWTHYPICDCNKGARGDHCESQAYLAEPADTSTFYWSSSILTLTIAGLFVYLTKRWEPPLYVVIRVYDTFSGWGLVMVAMENERYTKFSDHGSDPLWGNNNYVWFQTLGYGLATGGLGLMLFDLLYLLKRFPKKDRVDPNFVVRRNASNYGMGLLMLLIAGWDGVSAWLALVYLHAVGADSTELGADNSQSVALASLIFNLISGVVVLEFSYRHLSHLGKLLYVW